MEGEEEHPVVELLAPGRPHTWHLEARHAPIHRALERLRLVENGI